MLVTRAMSRLRDYPDLDRLLGERFQAAAEAQVRRSSESEILRNNTNLFLVCLFADQIPAYTATLETLQNDVVTFRDVPHFDRVIKRLTNLEKTTFLSAIAELALVRHLLGLGWRVEFDMPFALHRANGTSTTKDIDLRVQAPGGDLMLIEVFAPFSPKPIRSTPRGFLDIRPHGDEWSLAAPLERKLSDKLGTKGDIADLPTTALTLAVDILYHDRAFASSVLPTGDLSSEIDGCLRSLERPVPQVLLFRHSDRVRGHPVTPCGTYLLGEDGRYHRSATSSQRL